MLRTEPKLRVVIGLGNPGKEYAGTRHNLGRQVTGHVAAAARSKEVLRRKRCRVCRVSLARRRLFLVEPKSYVNESGRAVLSFLASEQIEPQEMLVVCDDVDLPLGGMRLRRSGSSGGHRGLESIIDQVGRDFPRLRLGVGSAQRDMVGHVLGEFSPAEAEVIKKMLPLAGEVIGSVMREGLERTMSKYNRKELWISL